MAKSRIAVLYDIWYEDPDEEEAPPAKKGRGKKKPDKEDHQEVHAALRIAGHSPFYYTIDGTLESLQALAKIECDLIFNMTASWAGDDTKDVHLAAYLDLCQFRYTGAGPFGLHLSQNKSLAKKIFAFHGISTPFFATVYRGRHTGFCPSVKPVAKAGGGSPSIRCRICRKA